VIREYETLKGEGVQLPTYAVRWVAAAYLDQREPEKAEPLYRQALTARMPTRLIVSKTAPRCSMPCSKATR
jgi:hypothetical protein